MNALSTLILDHQRDFVEIAFFHIYKGCNGFMEIPFSYIAIT